MSNKNNKRTFGGAFRNKLVCIILLFNVQKIYGQEALKRAAKLRNNERAENNGHAKRTSLFKLGAAEEIRDKNRALFFFPNREREEINASPFSVFHEKEHDSNEEEIRRS